MSLVVINHAHPADPDITFYPGVAQAFRAAGVDAAVPAMPGPPHLDAWQKTLADAVTQPPAQTVLAGHSIGAWNVLRLLEKATEPFAGAVLIATPAHYIHYPELVDFFTDAVDWDRIRSAARQFTIIHAADDPVVPAEHAITLRAKLDATLILLARGGHFASWDNVTDLPELRAAALASLV